MVNEVHSPQRQLTIQEIHQAHAPRWLRRRAGKVELLTGIEGVTSRPVWRIVLMK